MDLLYVLALLACPVGMGAMMWFMSKGMMGGNKQKDTQGSEAQRGDSVENLRRQQRELDANIARLEEHDVSARELEPAVKH